ncbi:sigma-54-dependent Fis family transcriptional regulator [Telmatocola sphagniphila]|uniref:Sigma-54-dependent Fis family transcriptional regulator n=1 Tax=Telmatocola sphagniphila TaxID=1123043 RepID=A0A8E6F0I4_9BACT|nr:sigma-54 dependent transcriptional regulator [Telmatocola sphagniphila]QVL34571.1 sigma-54-dependent Fis family transcriptional regulator [Telmatocola sphagniphila]
MTTEVPEPITGPKEPAISQRVLVVEDLEDTRVSQQQLLCLSLGLEVDTAEDGQAALSMLLERNYSLVITDLRMPKLNGMKLIEEINQRKLPVTVIVTTGHGGVNDAVNAMRMGAYDFLVKPPNPQHLCMLVQRALRERSLQDEVASLRQELGQRHSFQNVISKSPRMHDVFELIGQIATTSSTVLVIGETGSGKEQIARAIHQASAEQRPGAFVAINCAALPETLLESELFGHEKGAFTGATTQRKGRFEQAHKGTIFLDEIGDVPLAMQVKLLRVLQERKFERIGGTETVEIDVRVVAATHQALEKLVKDGKFREDLFYRLNVIRIDVPPLRDRPEDIPVLASFFAQKFTRTGQTPPKLSPEALQVLQGYSWPGNVRQLENALERACITARDGLILPKHLPSDISGLISSSKQAMQVDLSRSLPEQLSELVASFEKRYLRKALRRTRGHVGKTAKISGLSRRSVTEKIGHYAIDKAEFKKD